MHGRSARFKLEDHSEKPAVKCLSFNRFGAGIPGRNRFVEVRVVRQVASDRRMVSEDFILDRALASAHRVKEISLVRRSVAESVWSRENLRPPLALILPRRGLR